VNLYVSGADYHQWSVDPESTGEVLSAEVQAGEYRIAVFFQDDGRVGRHSEPISVVSGETVDVRATRALGTARVSGYVVGQPGYRYAHVIGPSILGNLESGGFSMNRLPAGRYRVEAAAGLLREFDLVDGQDLDLGVIEIPSAR
jgi:hypothetical protein